MFLLTEAMVLKVDLGNSLGRRDSDQGAVRSEKWSVRLTTSCGRSRREVEPCWASEREVLLSTV